MPLLNLCTFQTPLGEMTAIADQSCLYLLQFSDVCTTEDITEIITHTNKKLVRHTNTLLITTHHSVDAYFNGNLQTFEIALFNKGTAFEQQVWKAIDGIKYGATTSYHDIAHTLEMPQAARAIGNAVGKNNIALIVPCHRIVRSNGTLGGYKGGLARKEWLLNHEKRNTL